MTTLQLHTSHGLPRRRRQHDAIAALEDATRWVFAAFGEWRQRSRERAELAALDDRSLADIGLTRGDAEFLANKPFWKE